METVTNGKISDYVAPWSFFLRLCRIVAIWKPYSGNKRSLGVPETRQLASILSAVKIDLQVGAE